MMAITWIMVGPPRLFCPGSISGVSLAPNRARAKSGVAGAMAK